MGDQDQYSQQDDPNFYIDMETLATSIESKLTRNSSFMSPNCCIFKTPNILFRHNREAYIPNAFSIGPLHHGRHRLAATEKIKLQYLEGLISRASTPQTALRDLITEVAKLESMARSCYAPVLSFSREEFVKMLVLDGCFLVELFRKHGQLVDIDEDDPIFNVASMPRFLFHDLVLLENQIPWLVLDCLYNMTVSTMNKTSSLEELVIYFFRGSFFPNTLPIVNLDPPCKHILHLLRESLCFSSEMDSTHCEWLRFPSATALVEAGVKLQKGYSQSQVVTNAIISISSSLDIKFDSRRGILVIPAFIVHDITEATLRNLISFEQSYPNCEPRITCYVVMLDKLINTTKDLNILCDKRIVGQCCLDPEEATRIFNGLYHDASFPKFYYSKLCKDVNDYCERKWPRWRSMYVRNYFSTPWAIASQVFAAFLIIFAFLQTFFTIKK